MAITLPPAWRTLGDDPRVAAALTAAEGFAAAEEAAGHPVYPPVAARLHALALTAPEQARVVILGQDPYHGPGQAHGLAFSVPAGIKPPPSLRNIFAELASDLGVPAPGHGRLDAWARQGVLLLNATLSVRGGAAGSHAGRGWEVVTDAVIRTVSDGVAPVAFILWGNHAAKKAVLIDGARHLVLTSAHPSPLSARRGFLGSRPFSRVNAWLAANGRGQIDWTLPEVADVQ
ncbi:uracil-DNA glycosylase [Sphingomonas guangdongensis]|uniref:uracil-DNA glycosylase n=1 Tax=Sphingomonas guangdongensis TaxID=1141890 RepID=UPI000BE2FAF3